MEAVRIEIVLIRILRLHGNYYSDKTVAVRYRAYAVKTTAIVGGALPLRQ